MRKSEKNQIHILDLKEDKIRAFDNFDICSFLNDLIADQNPIGTLKDLKEKRFLFLPDQKTAFYVVESQVNKKTVNKGVKNGSIS